ncbi:hypothetical protein LTS14_010218 [Recurvomyces mirabilis]|uniref:uncharacterized protein n=1 Tax=Recurvomyces mirabilis TaxID=574656 RepID=UPI002DE0EE77|nr:hypothetical protein LTS14_010218 [Recurvomyces mirabilis]
MPIASAASLDNMVFYQGPPLQSAARKTSERIPASKSGPGEVVFSLSSHCQPPIDPFGGEIDTGSLKLRVASMIAPLHGQKLSSSQPLPGASRSSFLDETVQIPDAVFSTPKIVSTVEPVDSSRSPGSVAKLLGPTDKLYGALISSAGPIIHSRPEDTESTSVGETGDNCGPWSDGGVPARDLSNRRPSARSTSWPSLTACDDTDEHSVGFPISTRVPSADFDGSNSDPL